MLTLGSLFDGIGGFPLAAVTNGIVPLWASEIEAFPIAVTKVRFPDMVHVGDITKLNGAELPPVDIVTGGSPCQDLSVAGTRAGLAGERSGLFVEQVRIVKEMRCADERRGRTAHAVRPRYLVWENVPGAFSSAEGEDFHAVLTEIVRITDGSCHVPRPDSGAWRSAGGIVLGDQFSLAWRVLDAQYWPRTPQRRKRIYLVADFGGSCAPAILFKQDSLLGNPSSGGGPREGAAAPAQGGADDSGGAYLTSNSGVRFASCNSENAGHASDNSERKTAVAFATNQRDEVRNLYDVAGALGARPGMKQQTFIAEANCVDSWDAQQPKSMSQTLTGLDSGRGRKSARLPFAAGFCAGAGSSAGSIGYQEECVPTLKAADGGNMVPAILCLNDQGGKRIDLSQNISGTLRSDEHGHQPLVMATQQGGAEIGVGVCPAITAAAGTSGNNQPVLFENHGIDSRYTGPHDIAPTMSARYGTGGNNVPLVSGEPSSTDDRHTMFSRQRSDVFQENDVTATQSARQYKDATDLVRQPCGQKAIHPKLIRRLTPLECERLQGYPDGWTDIPGASDSARYKALGNSVAIPCVTFVLRGIAFALRRAMEEQ